MKQGTPLSPYSAATQAFVTRGGGAAEASSNAIVRIRQVMNSAPVTGGNEDRLIIRRRPTLDNPRP